jgi:predicted permease
MITIDTWLQDTRFAWRSLRRTPGSTILLLIAIATGIAANVAVFSMVEALFLRSIPARNPTGLVRIDGEYSYPEYIYIRDHVKTLEYVVAHYSTAPLYVTAEGESNEAQSAVVTSGYFKLLGLQPRLGRFFTPEEDSVPDRDAVAVISYDYWQSVYHGESKAVGRTLVINGHVFSVIGVMPRNFRGVEIGAIPNEIWIPSAMLRVGYRWCDAFEAECQPLKLMGRLAVGSNTAESGAEISGLLSQFRSAAGIVEAPGREIAVTPPIGISDRRDYFAALARLLTTVAVLLLVLICTNIAALLIARSGARSGEIMIRAALGAWRGRILRQVLTESLLLSGLGGVLGVIASIWTSRALMGFYLVDAQGYRHLFNLSPGASTLGFAIIVILATGIGFGILPAWHMSRADLNVGLREVRGTPNRRDNLTRMVLGAAQVAIALVLVAEAGLLAQSARHLESNPNMDLKQVVGLRVRPRLVGYAPSRAHLFLREALSRLRDVPSVESASLARGVGVAWDATDRIRMRLAGKVYPRPADEPLVNYNEVAPNYFATLRIPLIAGREFSEGDNAGSSPVTVVNETLARQLSPDKLPLDRAIILNDQTYRIVGVAKDSQLSTGVKSSVPVAYLPFWQENIEPEIDARLCVRIRGEVKPALLTIREAVTKVDPNVPVTEVMPLMEQVRGRFTDTRVAALVLSCSAGVALFLSALGLYSVMSFEADRRTKEIGIRLALGAEPAGVARLFLKRGLLVMLAGIGVGAVAAVGTSRLLMAWLVGVRPFDMVTFCIATLGIFAVGIVATYLPVRRASRMDPLAALRDN